MDNQSFGKEEKLKSKKRITNLFKVGKTLFIYPIKLVFLPLDDDTDNVHHQFGVSVPKKRFKKAVDRNRIKRIVREAYRLNKSQISSLRPLAMMAIYVADEELPFKRIESTIKKVLKLLDKSISKA